MIDPEKFGVSFSIKQCRNFKLEAADTLNFLIKVVGFKRFRLMSYWNEHENIKGEYDFSSLDRHLKVLAQNGCVVSLCLGVRQPRWPESHWPSWALELPPTDRYEALYRFTTKTVKRYRKHDCITSWQLENEALNRSFGKNGDFNRTRLRHEMALVRKLDRTRPITMSASNTWGLPLRSPRPDQFGFTLYQTQFENGAYSRRKLPLWWWSLRAKVIRLIAGKTSFIHELQAEPWGSKAIWQMSTKEQNISMNPEQLQTNIMLAKQTKLYPIDLWGGEWWYWRHRNGDDTIWQTIRDNLTTDI